MGPADELVWDDGNREHATRHGVSRQEIDDMYESAEWIVTDDPLGREGQYRLTGPTSVGRLITLAVEWIPLRGYRPISAWEATAQEARMWRRQMLDGE